MSTVYVLSGLPGSGKSTYAVKLATELNAVVHHYDDIPGANRKDTMKQSYKEFWKRIREDLSNGNTVIADGIHTSKALRRNMLDAVADIECQKVLVVMNTSLDECIRRNENREKPLSKLCILAIHANQETPTLNEGWDEIIWR